MNIQITKGKKKLTVRTKMTDKETNHLLEYLFNHNPSKAATKTFEVLRDQIITADKAGFMPVNFR